MLGSADECARQVLEIVPLVMAAIRTEIRTHRGSELSVPQFRVLIFLNRHAGASLSDIAEHLGLTLPSMLLPSTKSLHPGNAGRWANTFTT